MATMEKKAFLKVLSGPQEGNNIPLEDSAMVIGRRHGDIIIPDPLISSKHAKIFFITLTATKIKFETSMRIQKIM